MFRILKVLYSSKYSKLLGFTGGTALYFFYQLPRFSVDLDFNLTKNLNKKDIQTLKTDILNLLDSHLPDIKFKIDGTLTNSIRYIGQYEGEKIIKVEISSKMYDNEYEIKLLNGLPIQVMRIEYMTAHKLCALVSRYHQKNKIANRDLYDISFLMEKLYSPHPGILQQRSKKIRGKKLSETEVIKNIVAFITNNKKSIQKNILDGLGELIDIPQKQDIKKHLIDKVLQGLELHIRTINK